jgi:hypothetical protein
MATEFKTKGYIKGVQNKLPSEEIDQQASSDALCWTSIDGILELSRGRQALGVEGALGGVDAQAFIPKKNGDKVHFRKIGTKIQYYNGTTWTDVVTGLTDGAIYSFNSYISLAGAYLIATGIDGIYKIATANPASFKSMYDATKNYKGFSLLNEQRMFMWNISSPNIDKTGLYISKIDPQGTNYTTVTNENLGASGNTTYTGTLAEATGLRFVFGLNITGTTGAGVETFIDNYVGGLVGSLGGSGTINYATGAYSITFNGAVTSGNVEADYQYEDSNVGGITDFTFSAPRTAGEGDIIPQEYLGEPIQNVLVFEGKYYSFKKSCVYELDLTNDDVNATNIVYRSDIGIPSMRSCISTGKGMVYLDTANPDKPILSILQRNPIGGNLEPVNLTPLFKWENFEYEKCVVDTWGEFLLVSCNRPDSTFNDRTMLVNVAQNYSVDITYYGANVFSKNAGLLYTGDSLTQSTYQIFSGFDDLGDLVENYWNGKLETYGDDRLKRVRWFRFKGIIDPDQVIEVYCQFDDGDYTLLGTIRGDQSYVDYTSTQSIGSNGIGTAPLGGGELALGYNFLMQMRVRVPKFRARSLRFVATGIGYASLQWSVDYDVLTFEQRIPSQYRQKQHISLNGEQTDLPTFP